MSGKDTWAISNGGDFPIRHFYAEIPNLLDDSELDPYAYRLYGHYKRVAGVGGKAFEESIRSSAEHCHMSVGAVVKARAALVAGGWITVEEPAELGRGKPASRVTIVDRWVESIERYRPGSVHVVNTSVEKCSRGDTGSAHGVNTSLSLYIEEPEEEQSARARARERKPEPGPKTERKPNVSPLGKIIDAIRAKGGIVTVTARDGQALKACDPAPDPETVADAFLSAEQWGGAWLAENLCVRLVLERLSAYQAWVAGGKKARRNGYHPYQRPDFNDREAGSHIDPGADPHVAIALRRDPAYVARWNREHPERAWHG